ncbi:MAG: DinB family protein [Ferruginibacter sp.]|nr:DinB family protein [Ferruginibacter sp.]
MTKEEIILATEKEFAQLSSICSEVDDALFFAKPNEKWSVAENVKHLLISTNMSALAFWLPKFLVRWIGGIPNRPSKSYDELVAKYKLKLEQDAVASARFIPKPAKEMTKKTSLLQQWDKVNSHYLSALKKNRTEQDLDNYLIKHPLLGPITLRELCYFTIYHTQHHLQAIKNIID